MQVTRDAVKRKQATGNNPMTCEFMVVATGFEPVTPAV